jgi:hypothetical protein
MLLTYWFDEPADRVVVTIQGSRSAGSDVHAPERSGVHAQRTRELVTLPADRGRGYLAGGVSRFVVVVRGGRVG